MKTLCSNRRRRKKRWLVRSDRFHRRQLLLSLGQRDLQDHKDHKAIRGNLELQEHQAGKDLKDLLDPRVGKDLKDLLDPQVGKDLKDLLDP